ncbi:uncharacterized protein LOC135121410 [Zophobas morio]|uniref:uncharacterized protein LOC135119817 n=1 Tax=Zophobas morio TaxID=2755281 RepID=UPI0030838C90
MRSPKPREGEFLRLNVGKLQVWIDRGKIDPSKKITLKTLQDSKLCSRTKYGVKLLGDGALGFVSKIDIEISAASKTAIEAVERNGGRIVAKYYSPLTLRALLKPEKFKVLPKEFPPTKNKLLDFYTNPEKNGYLSSKFI